MLGAAEVDYPALVSLSAGFSGAEVVAAVQEAVMLAVERGAERVQQGDVEQAMLAVAPQITAEMLGFYAALQKAL